MRNVTEDEYREDVLALMQDTISMLLDHDEAVMARGAFTVNIQDVNKFVDVTVRLRRSDAARVIGKQHHTREALYMVFAGISKNHGYDLRSFTVIGLSDTGEVETQAVTDTKSILNKHQSRPRMDGQRQGHGRNDGRSRTGTYNTEATRA